MQIYLDNAATSSPKPEAVIEAMVDALKTYNANPGRSGHEASLKAAHCLYQTRKTIAELINAQNSSCISFHLNCTDALNLAIKGILQTGDHVVASMLEHNSVLRVLSGLSSRRKIHLTLVNPRPDGFIDPSDFKRSLRSNTKLIVLTHASNVTGAIQPAAAVCRLALENGIYSLIDGAQLLGAFPVNVNDLLCSMYAFPGHKSLLGPQGTGGLYIKSGIKIKPLREGGTGTDSDHMLQPDDVPECYESGTVNLPGLAGLRAGANYVSRNQSVIMMHERELCQVLYEGLQKMQSIELYSPESESMRAGIVSFNIADMSSSQAADALSQAGFAVRGGLHCAPGAHAFLGTLRRGTVRASIGHANTTEEIELFLRAVYNISKRA